LDAQDTAFEGGKIEEDLIAEAEVLLLAGRVWRRDIFTFGRWGGKLLAGEAAKERVFAEEGTLNALERPFFDTEEACGVKGIYLSVSVRC